MIARFQSDAFAPVCATFKTLVFSTMLATMFPTLSAADNVRAIICMKEDGSSGFSWSINYSRTQ